MLLQAASPLSIPIVVLDPDVNAPAKQVSSPALLPIAAGPKPLQHLDGAFTSASKIRELAQMVDILTIEIEHVDVSALEAVANEFKSTGGRSGKGVKIFPAPSVIRIIQDKFAQKEYLAQRGIPVAPFLPITAAATATLGDDPLEILMPSVLAAGDKFGYPIMLKSRHLAYDGKGNYLLKSADLAAVRAALAALVPAASIATGKPLTERLYAEKFAPFVKEVAVMVVRGTSGETRTYPAVETIHRESVCHIVYAPLRPPSGDKAGVGREQRGTGNVGGKDVNERAREDAERAIDALGEGAVGVFGVEMFLMADGSLLLNEIAPRPHNSGHYTIEACTPSQYTSHLFAILSIPLPPISFIPPSAGMLNLLGATSSASDDFLGPNGVVNQAIAMGAAVHLYGKSGCRKGRKMGHITVMGTSDDEVRTKIASLVDALPEMYRDAKPTPASSALQSLLPSSSSSTPRLTAPHGPFSSPNPLISIIMGSDSDLPVMLPATTILASFNIPFELSIVSAHRTPGRMVEFAKAAAGRGVRVVIAGAGGAAHLPGMVASETTLPVIGVPVKGSSLDGVDSLYSIVQMPRGIPVATVAINNSTNAALLAVRILSSQLPRLSRELEQYAENLEDEVMAKIARLEDGGWADYVVKKLPSPSSISRLPISRPSNRITWDTMAIRNTEPYDCPNAWCTGSTLCSACQAIIESPGGKKFKANVLVFTNSDLFREAASHAARTALRMASPNPADHMHRTSSLSFDIAYNEDLEDDPHRAFEILSIRRGPLDDMRALSEWCMAQGLTGGMAAPDTAAVPWAPDSPELIAALGQEYQLFRTMQIYRFKSINIFAYSSVFINLAEASKIGVSAAWELESAHFASDCYDRQLIPATRDNPPPPFVRHCRRRQALQALADNTKSKSTATAILFSGLEALHLVDPESPHRDAYKTHALVLVLRPCSTAEFGFLLVDAELQPHSEAIKHLQSNTGTTYTNSYFDRLELAQPASATFSFNVVLVEEGVDRFRHAYSCSIHLPVDPYLKIARGHPTPSGWKTLLLDVFNGPATPTPSRGPSEKLYPKRRMGPEIICQNCAEERQKQDYARHKLQCRRVEESIDLSKLTEKLNLA
ncbi:hypothetical protein RQP46_001138 [Phenoliferia psychrophenolica]